MKIIKKFLSHIILTNKKTGSPSYTLTACAIGFLIINIKLLLSGIEFGPIKMSEFNGFDYSECLAAISLLYVGNKHMDNIKKDK